MSDPCASESAIWPLLFDALSAVSAAVIAGVAVYGVRTGTSALSTWRAEALWKDDRELARRIMLQVNETEDGFRHVRNPLQTAYEHPDDAKEDAHRSSPERRRVQEHVYTNRIEVLLQSLRSLDASMREAEVVWDAGAGDIMKVVRQLYNDLRWQVSRHVASQYPDEDDPFDFKDPEASREMSRVIYDISGSATHTDSFAESIEDALEAIRAICRPKLERSNS